MAKLKKKKGLKDVTGDGKFTFADVLKMRGVKPKKKSMGAGGKTMTESEYLDLMRRLDPEGEYRSDRLDLSNAKPVGQMEAIIRSEGNFHENVAKDPNRFDPTPEGNIRMSVGDIIRKLEDDDNAFSRRQAYEGALQQVYSKYPQGKDARTDAENLELSIEVDKVRRKYGMGYGGKVKLKSQGKGGVVEYGFGGALTKGLNEIVQGNGLGAAAAAAAKGFVTPGSGIGGAAQLAGNLAAKSNNPMLQNIGKMAGMASNFLPGGNPMNALQGLFQQKHGGYVSPKHMLRRG